MTSSVATMPSDNALRASSLIRMWRELESDGAATPRSNSTAPPSTDDAESDVAEGRKVCEIVRMLSLRISSSIYVSDLAISKVEKKGGKNLRFWRRREIDDFVLKLVKERGRELAALGDRHLVSRFSFRGRIQSLIRLRSLRKEVATIRHQQRSQKLEMERFETPNKFFSRQRPQDIKQHDINDLPNEENTTVIEAQPLESDVSAIETPINSSQNRNNHFSKSVSAREKESEPQSRYEDPLESQSSHMLQTCKGEFFSKGTETSTNWLSQSSNSRRRWSVVRRSFCNGLLNSSSKENGELRELQEMRTVSTSLASEFSVKMNQVIASFLHRQGKQYADLNGREECEEQGIWRWNYESSSEQEGVGTSLERQSSAVLHNHEIRQNTSLSLASQMLENKESWQGISLPLPSHKLESQNGWKNSSFTESSSSSAQEGEDIRDLKYSLSQIQNEISDLRKLVESCLDWQKKLGHSIKKEVFSAINQSERGNLSNISNKFRQGRKDSCCICCEAQVDTLLYRCGHMCTCHNCAQELQWSSGRCPICRSLIADVIRAYPNS